MSKIQLSQCTLVCGDGMHKIDPIIKLVTSFIEFGEVIVNKNITSLQRYNLFITKELPSKLKTSHCMIVQHDGYPINYNAWDKSWLDFDYIGAPWINQPWPRNISVGNGGFSIRSSNLMDRVAKFDYDGSTPEDVFICRVKGIELQREGFKFAPIEIAYAFSVEDTYYKGQFGFHGKKTIEINKAAGIF